MILVGFVWVSWIPGARGRAGSGGIWQHLAAFWDRVWTLLLVCKIRSSDDHKDLWFLAWFSMVLLVCKIRSSDDHKDLWCLAWFSMDFIDLR